MGRFDPIHGCIPRAQFQGSYYISIGLQMSGFLAVEVVNLQPPDLSENHRVLLLVGVIIVVSYLFFSFTFG